MKNVYVTKPYLPEIEKYEKYLEEIWQNGILTNKGVLHNKLIEKLANKLDTNVSNINLFCNGHSALEWALKSLNLKKGGEIITTPFTFVSTTHAIVNGGFKPVFCDIKESNMTIDESKVEDLITDKTVAILPVHVYGFSCDTEKLAQIASKHNLKLVYDAAHAFGVKKDGKSILLNGDVSMVSFHATKIFNTIEGGMTISREQEVAERQGILENFGITDYEDVGMIGGNSKMNEFCAAMGLATIDDLEKVIEKRQKLVEIYKENLLPIEGIKTYCEEEANIKQNYAYFPIRVNKEEYGLSRDELKTVLEENGIYPRKYFYPLTSDVSCYNGRFASSKLDTARKVSEEILTLPIYYDLEEEQVGRICKVLQKKR